MKWYQAVTIAEEVQTLRERATILLNMHFLLQPSLNYFSRVGSDSLLTTLPSTPSTPSTTASHNMRDEGDIRGYHRGVIDCSVRLCCHVCVGISYQYEACGLGHQS